MFRPVRQVAALEAKSAVSDCIVLQVLHLDQLICDCGIGGGGTRSGTLERLFSHNHDPSPCV